MTGRAEKIVVTPHEFNLRPNHAFPPLKSAATQHVRAARLLALPIQH